MKKKISLPPVLAAFVFVYVAIMLCLNFAIIELNTTPVYAEEIDYGDSYEESQILQGEDIALLNNTGEDKQRVDEVGVEHFTNLRYIPNGRYFINNPNHFLNTSGVNLTGVCTTVAMQLMLGYHNYYTDRRIIPATMLGTEYGILTAHPLYCNEPAPGQGSLKTGVKNTVYQKIFDLTTWAKINQMLPSVVAGTRRFMNTYSPTVSSSMNLSWGLYDSVTVLSELRKGRPVILGFDPVIRQSKEQYHVVVAYGTATYNNQFGYITHFGWGEEYTCVWVPASWVGYISTMSFTHKHSFTEVNENITGNYRHVNCSVCNCDTYDMLFDIDYNGEIKGRKYPFTDAVIPETYYGNTVTGIGSSAFVDKSDIYSLTLPDGITKIGNSAFKGCTNLQLEIPESVREIGDYAFKNCYALNTQLPGALRELGVGAFYDCRGMTLVTVPVGMTEIKESTFQSCFFTTCFLPAGLIRIGKNAFAASKLSSILIPSTVTEIREFAFAVSDIEALKFVSSGSLQKIGDFAFAACRKLTGSVFIPTNVNLIGAHAFYLCEELEACAIPNNVNVIEKEVFLSCKKLTIYAERNRNQTGWNTRWNSDNRPVIYNVQFSSTKDTISSVNKSANNFVNINTNTVVNNPKRAGYTFAGWYDSSDFSGAQYTNLATAPDGTLYAKWDSNSCVTAGTMVTLADGSQKAVEELTGDEQLLVWNMLTGTFDTAPILFIDFETVAEYEIIELTFSDGTKVRVIDEHAFWDYDLNKYVYLRKDASSYIGHWFNKYGVGENNNFVNARVKLVGVEIYSERTTAWSPVTYGHLCIYVNGMLSMPGATESFVNIFDVDGETMKYDEEAMARDIETYGLFTYEEFYEIVPVSEEIFNAFNGQYLKVAIGKGKTNIETILALFERYVEFF